MTSTLARHTELLTRWIDHLEAQRQKPSTIARKLATLATVHALAGLPCHCSSQLVRDAMRGLACLFAPLLHVAMAVVLPGILRLQLSGSEVVAVRDHLLITDFHTGRTSRIGIAYEHDIVRVR